MLDGIDRLLELPEIEELSEHQEEQYTEAGLVDVTTFTTRASMISINLGTSVVITDWFPFSQMRKLDGELYLSKWILHEKGLMS